MRSTSLPRRARAALAPALAAAVLLATATGCGSDDDSGDAAAAPAATTTTTTQKAALFPVKVDHRFGSTVVASKPNRIVVVGLTEQDTVLALGYQPVGTTEWYGDQPYAVWPWARAALGDAKPTVLKASDGIDFEAVAKLRPDLIIGTNSGIKNGDYKKLSALAPTIAAPKGATDYFSPWDAQTELIAKALGMESAGQAMVADVRRRFAEVAAAHPEFKGKTITFSQNAFYDGKLYVYPPGLNTEFLSYLGFTINPKLKGLAPAGVQADISAERLGIIDTDVLVFATEKAADVRNLLKIPTFRPLKAVAGHRAVFTGPTLSGAMYFMTPLSLPYVLEHLTPLLEQAVAGKAPLAIARD
jgi:iron complex transport system substrate-binding protein